MALRPSPKDSHHHPLISSSEPSDWSRYGVAQIKKLLLRKLMGPPKILGVDHFQDPVGHFEAPWWPFWIFEVLIEGMILLKMTHSGTYGRCGENSFEGKLHQ